MISVHLKNGKYIADQYIINQVEDAVKRGDDHLFINGRKVIILSDMIRENDKRRVITIEVVDA